MGDMESTNWNGYDRKLPDETMLAVIHCYQKIVENIPAPNASSVLRLLNRNNVLPKKLEDAVQTCCGEGSRSNFLLSDMMFYTSFGQYMH